MAYIYSPIPVCMSSMTTSLLAHDIKNNAWVVVNNDFWSRVRWFAKDFHEWQSHEWKSLANHLTRDQKVVIHGNECIILFLTCYFIYWTYHSATNKHRSLISPLLLMMVFSDLTLWRHHSWSVTSCKHKALALWRHICWLFLHVHIGANAIFTSEKQAWISISHHPVFTTYHVRNMYSRMIIWHLSGVDNLPWPKATRVMMSNPASLASFVKSHLNWHRFSGISMTQCHPIFMFQT